MVKDADHKKTRTWGSRGRETKREDQNKTFRQILARDLWHYRTIGLLMDGNRSHFNAQIRLVIAYYKRNHPGLI